MNMRHDDTDRDAGSAVLRMQLRALRTDIDPPPQVWDAVAARLDEAAPAPPRRRAQWPLALAATLSCAALAGWWALPQLRPAAADPTLAATFDALDRDARDLRAALAQAPDSPLLLHQLHRVDALRRTLEQRATL